MILPLTTFMYHYVRPAAELPSAGYGGTDVDVFAAQLDAICRHGTPVGWPQVTAALHGEQELPSDAVLLTFDDGLLDHRRHVLPQLAARGLPAIFFVMARAPTDGLTLGHSLHVLVAALGSVPARDAIVEHLSDAERQRHATLEAAALAENPHDPEDAWKRPLQREMRRSAAPALARVVRARLGSEEDLARGLYMDEADLVALIDAGVHLGGHGREHLWLDFEDGETVREELRASMQQLERLQPGLSSFAYPYGGVSATSAQEVERAGFRAAFTTVRRSDSPFRLGRIDGDSVAPADVQRVLSK